MRRAATLSAVAILCTCATSALAISNGQLDDFNAGSALGWDTGSAQGTQTPNMQLPNGGPGGTGDGYLLVDADGFHLGAANDTAAWTGDYLAAGVDAIELDARNDGPDDIALRVVLFGPGGMFALTDRAPVTTGGGWQHVSLSLAPADLTHVTGGVAPDGTGDPLDTLGDVTKLLIRNDYAIPTPSGQHPPHITASAGYDNIQAVPEPTTALLLGAAGVGLIARRRR